MTIPLMHIADRLRTEGLLASGATVPQDAGGLELSGLTTDSRLVRPGVLFCAVRGVAGDGHAFLADAAAAGAPAALVERADPSIDLPQIVVTDGRRAAAFAAAAYYGDPGKDQTLIGVTGTNGKTTTVAILRHVMAKDRKAASLGSLGLIGPDGRVIEGTEGLTTPGPAQFAELLAGLRDEGVKAVAMEVSSHALDQDRVAAAEFDAAVFTNFSRDHLDYHQTFEAYRSAKLKLTRLVRDRGVITANIDDPAWDGIGREGAHLVRYGTKGRGEVQAENIRLDVNGSTWLLYTPSCTAEVRLPLVGMYNIYNALAAAAALWALGWTADGVAESLSDIGQIPGRLERVSAPGGPQVLIDFAHTPEALERALTAARSLTTGRVIVVFGAGGDRDRGKRPEMGRVAGRLADLSIVTSDNPRHEDPAAIISDIESGMGGAERRTIPDRRQAIEAAIELAAPEDVILIAGKGHETYQIWGDEKRPFDERAIVGEILNEKGLSS